ncbi:MAG: hypothetical protein U1F71_12860 [Verrucomicrobiaceae bacterium]
MRFFFVVCLSLLTCNTVLAHRNNLGPMDFDPLTTLPWVEKREDTLEHVIERIFREPNLHIRYPVLGEYLRQIPTKDLDRAFDQAVALEGTQTPDEMVSFLLYIWAQRDPVSAWKKTRPLFDVVGIEHGWLAFDSWENDPIQVQNRSAIEKSPFWLRRSTLLGFAEGLDDSKVSETERVGMMKAFADLWFERFKCWPKGGPTTYHGRTPQDACRVISAFNTDSSTLNLSIVSGGSWDCRAGCEVLWRRWLVSHPDRMSDVIESIRSTFWPSERWPEPTLETAAKITPELLHVWLRINALAFKVWASEVHTDPFLFDAAQIARCMIMTEVPSEQRSRWVSQMLHGEAGTNNIERLAEWQPQIAMESAMLVEGDLELHRLVDSCAYGPWGGVVWNTTHSGFGYLKKYRLKHLPEPLRKKLEPGWFECTFMEQWGDLDIGEAARFGLNLLLTDLQASRTDLLATLRGSDPPQSDDGIWDRTFCALRVWAVVRPTEMKKWADIQKSEDLRSALTWLLEHPWGGPEAKP